MQRELPAYMYEAWGGAGATYVVIREADAPLSIRRSPDWHNRRLLSLPGSDASIADAIFFDFVERLLVAPLDRLHLGFTVMDVHPKGLINCKDGPIRFDLGPYIEW